MSSYHRELSQAQRNICELADLVNPWRGSLAELTVTQLAQAIGLAGTAHRALLRAMAARHAGDEQ